MNKILETAVAYWRSAVLFNALSLNLFEKIGERLTTPEELADSTGEDTASLKRLLRALAAMKLLLRVDDRYRCSEDTLSSLIAGREKNLSHFCRVVGEDFFGGYWVNLSKPARVFQPEPVIVEESPADPALFTLAMQNLSLQGEASALIDAVDLSDKHYLLDLGAGSASYTIAFCRKNPSLQATVIDKPEVMEVARRIILENEQQDRIQTIGADWDDTDYREEFDAVLLSDVLYQEEAKSQKLVKIAQQALKPGGKLVIRGYFLDDTDDRLFPALFDINMQVHGKDQRSFEVAEIIPWLDSIDMTDIQSNPLTELSYLITAVKPAKNAESK